MRHLELGQRIDTGPRLHLLIGTHQHVEGDESSDDDAGGDLPDEEGDDRHDHEHDVHRVRELGEGYRPDTGRGLLRDRIRPVPGLTRFDLGRIETDRDVDFETSGHLFHIETVPGDVLDRGRGLDLSCCHSVTPEGRSFGLGGRLRQGSHQRECVAHVCKRRFLIPARTPC